MLRGPRVGRRRATWAGRHPHLACRAPLRPTAASASHREIRAHIPERFWAMSVMYRAAREVCEFKWARGRLFDGPVARMLHEACLEAPTATVLSVSCRPGAAAGNGIAAISSSSSSRKSTQQHLRSIARAHPASGCLYGRG